MSMHYLVLRTVAALLVAAVAASGLVLCPCERPAAGDAGDHDCCAATLSWQPAADCCDADADRPTTILAGSDSGAAALAPSADAATSSSAFTEAVVRFRATPSAAYRPPRTVLRI